MMQCLNILNSFSAFYVQLYAYNFIICAMQVLAVQRMNIHKVSFQSITRALKQRVSSYSSEITLWGEKRNVSVFLNYSPFGPSTAECNEAQLSAEKSRGQHKTADSPSALTVCVCVCLTQAVVKANSSLIINQPTCHYKPV